MGNLTLALVKMSNSPGSAAPPPPTQGLNIDRCIKCKNYNYAIAVYHFFYILPLFLEGNSCMFLLPLHARVEEVCQEENVLIFSS